MEEIRKNKLIEVGKWMAALSTAIGTVILLAYLVFKADTIAFSGIIYMYIATVVNGIYFLVLLLECFRKPNDWRKPAAMMLIMLLNIPLSVFYCYLALTIKF